MRAVINKGTDKEISWDMDEYITPELVSEIRIAGAEKKINWKDSPLYDLVGILLDSTTVEELEERIFDEDPLIIDLIKSELDMYIFEDNVNGIKELARLYLPIMLVILFIHQE